MPEKIELNARDLEIKTWNGRKIVRLKGGVAFDEGFLEEAISKGVKERPIDEDEEEETEEETED